MADHEMDGREQAIWNAAYASAFVGDFFSMYRFINEEHPNRVGAFDRALECGHAEIACTIADAAVMQLREYMESRVQDPDHLRAEPAKVPVIR